METPGQTPDLLQRSDLHISQLGWERPGIPPEEPESVSVDLD